MPCPRNSQKAGQKISELILQLTQLTIDPAELCSSALICYSRSMLKSATCSCSLLLAAAWRVPGDLLLAIAGNCLPRVATKMARLAPGSPLSSFLVACLLALRHDTDAQVCVRLDISTNFEKHCNGAS